MSSRFEPSEEQRKDKERYEHKEREAIRMEAKRRKVMDRKVGGICIKSLGNNCTLPREIEL